MEHLVPTRAQSCSTVHNLKSQSSKRKIVLFSFRNLVTQSLSVTSKPLQYVEQQGDCDTLHKPRFSCEDEEKDLYAASRNDKTSYGIAAISESWVKTHRKCGRWTEILSPQSCVCYKRMCQGMLRQKILHWHPASPSILRFLEASDFFRTSRQRFFTQPIKRTL